jgi:hypothetical protein
LVTVSYDGQVVERSGVLASIDELVAWAEEHSAYVRVTKGADNVLPAAGTSATLAGGVDDASVAAADLEAALARLPYELGPGQVAAPGLTSNGAHDALLAHGEATRRNVAARPSRLGRRDGPSGRRRRAGRDAGRALRRRVRAVGDLPVGGEPGDGGGAVLGDRGRADRAFRRRDRQPERARRRRERDLPHGARPDADLRRRRADRAQRVGVDVAIVKYGDVRTYGYRRGGPDDPNWLWYGNSRVVNAIAHEATRSPRTTCCAQIDGQGIAVRLAAQRPEGDAPRALPRRRPVRRDPDEAFASTRARRSTRRDDQERRGARRDPRQVSPAAEWVQISIVKVPIERSIAA